MFNNQVKKYFKLSFSLLTSLIMLSASCAITTFASTKEATARSDMYGELNVIVESSDNSVPDNSKLQAKFVTDDDLEVQDSEFDILCSKIDNNLKGKMERLGIFNIELFNQNGNKITKFDKNVSVFIEIPKNFDKQDVQIYYISDGKDEKFERTVITRNGKNYIKFETNHLSPFALIDEETKGTFYSILGVSIIGCIIISTIVVYLIYKKKQYKA